MWANTGASDTVVIMYHPYNDNRGIVLCWNSGLPGFLRSFFTVKLGHHLNPFVIFGRTLCAEIIFPVRTFFFFFGANASEIVAM